MADAKSSGANKESVHAQLASEVWQVLCASLALPGSSQLSSDGELSAVYIYITHEHWLLSVVIRHGWAFLKNYFIQFHTGSLWRSDNYFLGGLPIILLGAGTNIF